MGEGCRNDTLWLRCMRQALHCDDFEALLDVARTANESHLPPLEDEEVVSVATSAWGYTERGQNYIGRSHLRIAITVVDELLSVDPDAYILHSLLLRHHADRNQFVVANVMADTMPPHGSGAERFRPARTRLLDHAFIVRVRRASSIYGAAVYA